MSGTCVDHRGVKHRFMDGSARVGTAVCGIPPRGNTWSDPGPNMDPRAPFKTLCTGCYKDDDTVLIGPPPGRVDVGAGGASTPLSDDELRELIDQGLDWEALMEGRRVVSHKPPPDPLTAPWSDLVVEG